MIKVLCKAAVSAVLSLSLVACSGVTDQIKETVNTAAEAAAQMINGDVTGEIGELYSTAWFEFTVKSIERVDSYAGYSPADDMQLIDVVINEKNIFEDEIPMGTFDFYIDENADAADYWVPLEPRDDTMMPEEFYLAVGESAEYHMVFEVPAEYNDLNLVYVEIDEDDGIGATFTIKFTVTSAA